MALFQLLAMGMTRGAIEHRVATGCLHVVHRGVYAVGHPRLTVHGRRLAAVLACGPEAVLSHRDAASLWSLLQGSLRPVDVTAPGRTRHRREGIAVHRPRRLHRADLTERDGIPVTTVARTLLDLAEVVPLRRLRHAVEASERLRLFDLRAVEASLARNPGRRGIKPLRLLLAQGIEPEDVRTVIEQALLDLCRGARFPMPAMNVVAAGYCVDAFWADYRLVAELDGRASHEIWAQAEEDRIRDAELQAAGFRVVRFTHRRITRAPAEVEAVLRRLLSQDAPLARLRG